MSQPDPDCPFCRIAAGTIPASKVLESDRVVAFLDIAPVNLGHVLLVPKAHHANLTELSSSDAALLGGLLPQLTRAILAVTGADGLNLVINNGQAAGQTVDHGHWHLIPRFHSDAVRWPWPHLSYPGEAMGQMQDQLVAALADVSS